MRKVNTVNSSPVVWGRYIMWTVHLFCVWRGDSSCGKALLFLWVINSVDRMTVSTVSSPTPHWQGCLLQSWTGSSKIIHLMWYLGYWLVISLWTNLVLLLIVYVFISTSFNDGNNWYRILLPGFKECNWYVHVISKKLLLQKLPILSCIGF